jgi:hypothetical protein
MSWRLSLNTTKWWIKIIASPSPEFIPQKILSRHIDQRGKSDLFQILDLPHKSRLRSLSGPHALEWLNVTPSPNLGFKLLNPQFQILLAWILGQKICFPPTCSCGLALDPLGFHATTCKTLGDLIARHNSIRDSIHYISKECGLTSELEKAGILGDVGDKRRPADVYITNYSLGKDYCLDVAVTSPTQEKYLAKSAEVDGYAASEYHHFKFENYHEEVEKEGHVYLPIVVESYGRWSKSALEFLQNLARKYSDRLQVPRSYATGFIFKKLSFALQSRNANMLLKRAEI